MLAWLAVGAATAKTVAAVLVGIDPVVIAILIVAVLGLGRSMVDDPVRLAVAVLAVAAYLADVPEIGILLAGAVLVMAWQLLRAHTAGLAIDRPSGRPRPRQVTTGRHPRPMTTVDDTRSARSDPWPPAARWRPRRRAPPSAWCPSSWSS